MTTYRITKTENYAVILNEPLNDSGLSWEARGVLAYLLSKPNGWEVRNHDLINQSDAGEHKIKRIIAELKEAGYMRRYRVNSDDGQFTWITDVYESPSMNPDHKNTIGRLSTDGSPTDGLSIDGKPHRIVSTESQSTELVNTEAAAESKKPTPEQLNHKELALRLSTIMGYDKLPIKAVVKDLNTLTKWLVDIGASVADVEQFGRYWWGDKPPSPYQVKSYWAQAMAQKEASKPKSNITPLPGVAEAIRRIEAQNGN